MSEATYGEASLDTINLGTGGKYVTDCLAVAPQWLARYPLWPQRTTLLLQTFWQIKFLYQYIVCQYMWLQLVPWTTVLSAHACIH